MNDNEPLYKPAGRPTETEREFGKKWDTPKGRKAVADFTRVCEQTGMIEQLRKE